VKKEMMKRLNRWSWSRIWRIIEFEWSCWSRIWRIIEFEWSCWSRVWCLIDHESDVFL